VIGIEPRRLLFAGSESIDDDFCRGVSRFVARSDIFIFFVFFGSQLRIAEENALCPLTAVAGSGKRLNDEAPPWGSS